MTFNRILDARSRGIYRDALVALKEAAIPFLVGGAFALGAMTGVERHTGDLDLFFRKRDVGPAMDALGQVGYRVEMLFPHWLGKAYVGECYVDLIFNSGNGVAAVDDLWFKHAIRARVLGLPVGLCPAEEMIWSKAYIMERERYDGADIAHIIRGRGLQMDWKHLLERFGPHWPVLFSHLVMYDFIYPGERSKIPDWVRVEMLSRLENHRPPENPGRICQGTVVSREQYLVDIQQWGYEDARRLPPVNMSDRDIHLWTAGIKRDDEQP